MTATNKESMNKPSTLIDKCEKNEVVQLREANVEDAKVLHKLICKSTKTQLIITVQQLEADLRKIDTNGLETNTSFIRCLLAESGNNIIGYLMFYYYYTPWIGHSLYVADVFVKPDFRKQGKYSSFRSFFTIYLALNIFTNFIHRSCDPFV